MKACVARLALPGRSTGDGKGAARWPRVASLRRGHLRKDWEVREWLGRHQNGECPGGAGSQAGLVGGAWGSVTVEECPGQEEDARSHKRDGSRSP